jgi:transposase InsO family protein
MNGLIRGRPVRTTIPAKNGRRAGDLLDSDFSAPWPNHTWVTDFTYVPTWTNFGYVAFAIDLLFRMIVGWHVSTVKDTAFVEACPRMALWRRDHVGSQYAFAQIANFATANGITRSMGRTGVCWDNAMAESFFATLKTEFCYRRVWPTRERAKLEVGAWIEGRYNRRRRHASLGRISPVSFELQYSN